MNRLLATMPTTDLTDRIALVTGGTGALGRSIVRRLLRSGARVHATWRSDEERADFERDLGQAAAQVALHRVDVTVPAAVSGLFQSLAADPGRLDILACIAGGFSAAPVEATAPGVWDKMLAINATSTFLCCRAAVELLRRAQGRGRIVSVAARPALERGSPNMSAYAASKGAVLTLTYSLARELARDGITVNAIVPSIIDTPANRTAMPKAKRTNWLDPEEIAEVVAFLVSDAGGIVTGSAVNLARGLGLGE